MKSGGIWMELNVLHRHGWTVSQLASGVGISRTTVYKELASEEPCRYNERAKPRTLNERRWHTWRGGWRRAR